MNKNKCICIAALSGLISALSFNINCLWFAIFFSISPVFYVILKYKSHTKLILFNFTFIFYCISDIWILSIGVNYFENKYLGIIISCYFTINYFNFIINNIYTSIYYL